MADAARLGAFAERGIVGQAGRATAALIEQDTRRLRVQVPRLKVKIPATIRAAGRSLHPSPVAPARITPRERPGRPFASSGPA